MSANTNPEIIRCGRCGHAVHAAAWHALPRERTLTGADVAAYVSGWPEDTVVEVRRCASCGGDIARRARTT